MAGAREASDTVDPTSSCVGHIGNHGRDNVDGGARSLHPHDTTRDLACNVNMILAEVWAWWFWLGRPLTGSIQPHLAPDNIVNHGRDSVDGGGRRLHPHDTTGDPACSVTMTLAEVWKLLPGIGRPLTVSLQPHLPWAT
jgi:hypothetical protein